MVVQISSAMKNVGETLCSLTFAQRVRSVELGEATRKVENNGGKDKFKESQVRDTSVNLTSTIFPIHFGTSHACVSLVFSFENSLNAMLFIFFSSRQTKAENLVISHAVGDQEYYVRREENLICVPDPNSK